MLAATVNDLCGTCHDLTELVAKKLHHKWPAAALTCTSCHNPHGTPNRGLLIRRKVDMCKYCHGEGNVPKPASHDDMAVWKKAHGKEAKVDKGPCFLCHDWQDFCMNCHGGVEMPHPANWSKIHKDHGARHEPDAPCFRCHERKYCGLCHTLTQTQGTQT
jgi:predicted CXXCH cytochrome family protein